MYRAIRTITGQIMVALALCAAIFVPNLASASVDPDQIATRTAQESQIQFHYLDRYAPAIDELEQKTGPAVDRLTKMLGLGAFEDVDVWVLPKVADYFELQGEQNRAPEWAIGLSLGDRQTVVVARETQMPGGGSNELDKTYIHELAHVAIDVARGDGEVPRWFHEGVALMAAEEWTAQRRETLSQAASTSSLMSLSELERNFPAHHRLSSLAYAESFHFVRYLRDRQGEESFALIMKQVRQGTDFSTAVREATGESLAALESNWNDQLTENTSWIALLRDDFAIFFGAAMLFIIGWIFRKRRIAAPDDDEDDATGQWSYDKSKYPLPGDDDG